MTDDRRIKRTKKALKNGLMELMAEKPISKITIKELTEIADVNRSTFYLHYTDIFDLYDSIKSEYLEELLDAAKPSAESLYQYYLNLLKFMEKHTEKMKILDQDISFTEEVINVLKKQYLESWLTRFSNSNRMHYEYFYCFVTEGSLGVIKQWCRDENRASPETMAKILAKFAESGFSLLQKKDIK